MTNFAFIPTELFDEQNANFYLPVSGFRRKRANVVIRKFDYFGIVGVFNNSENVDNPTHTLFDLLEKAKSFTGEIIIAEIKDNLLYMIAIDGKKLLLANVFEINKNEDIAYWVLSAVEKTNLDIDKVLVKISSGNKSIIPFLNKYIKAEEQT